MSKQLSEKLKKEILNEISFLLGRAKKTITCPLSRDEITKAWLATFDPAVIRALEILAEHSFSTNSYLSSQITTLVILPDANYKVSFRENLIVRPLSRGDEPTFFQSRWPLGVDRLKDFLEWVEYAGTIDLEFKAAITVTDKLLDICKTVGQVNRAMPELCEFMPYEIKEALREQKRSSNMPYEWATMNKTQVTNAQSALAKAYLLPDQGKLRRLYGDIHLTWASKLPLRTDPLVVNESEE